MHAEHLDQFIEYLEQVRVETFHMGHYFRVKYEGEEKTVHECGTSACLAGHCVLMNADPIKLLDANQFTIDHDFLGEAQAYLGLDHTTARALFIGDGVNYEATLAEAIDVMKAFRQTGRVDWSATRRRWKDAGNDLVDAEEEARAEAEGYDMWPEAAEEEK